MKKKITLNTYCYDCGHLFINFSFFELLGKFYCFIMKRKNAPISILKTELTDTLAKGPVIIYRLGGVGGFWAKHDEI